jgi:hypothetical protein
MQDNQDIACPTITRFQLWDPNVLKELVSDLYAHLTRTLKYIPNEDGVYESKCSWCKTRSCWTESKAFLTKRGLDAETVIELLQNDFHMPAACDRDFIHTYRLEEVLKEIDYQRIHPLRAGNNNGNPQWDQGVAVDAVLKITNPDNPQGFTFGQTVFLYKNCEASSGRILNDIKKAYGIARRIRDSSYIFLPNSVASCLITATMEIPSWNCSGWSYIDRRPSDVGYFYFLNLDLLGAKWRLKGQKYNHGNFLVDEWKVQEKHTQGSYPVDGYDLLKTFLDGE